MKKLLLLFTAIIAVATVQAQSLKQLFDNTTWTDGSAFYNAEVKGNFINMTGGTCHEGGFAFGLKCTDADPNGPWFSLENGTWSEDLDIEPSISIPFPQGSTVITYNLDDDTYLVVEDKKGDAAYCFRKMKKKESLRPLLVSQQKLVWTGNYKVTLSTLKDCPVGTDCEISAAKFRVGSWVNGGYQVCDEYESPTNIAKLSNGRYVKIMPHGYTGKLRGGLSIYEVDYDKDNEVYDGERLIMVLDRVRGNNSPRWPTDKRLILPGEVTNYTKKELRTMRNEIFARHGYRFSSADLNEYFQGESWYTKDSDPDINNKIHFSLIESLNISMMKYAETNEDYELQVEDHKR